MRLLSKILLKSLTLLLVTLLLSCGSSLLPMNQLPNPDLITQAPGDEAPYTVDANGNLVLPAIVGAAGSSSGPSYTTYSGTTD